MTGPDGNVWFTVPSGNAIGLITPAGHMRLFQLPTAGSLPFGIASGPDGNLWVTEEGRHTIARLTPGGTLMEFPLPASEQRPTIIIVGPGGALWFLEQSSNRIGRLTTAGMLTGVVVLPDASAIHDLTVGPDGNVWVTQQSDQIGWITPAGQVTEFALARGSDPFGIVFRPGGELWYTERGSGLIGTITPVGVSQEVWNFNPGWSPHPLGIAEGSDGNLWYTVSEPAGGEDEIVGFDLTGTLVQDITLPKFESLPDGIVAGPDGNLWFTERGQPVIGRVTLDGRLTEFPITATP